MCRNWFLDETWSFRMPIFISTVYCSAIKIFLTSWFAALLEEANSKPFTISPPTMANTVKNIHSVNTGKDRYSEGKNSLWTECKIAAKVAFTLLFTEDRKMDPKIHYCFEKNINDRWFIVFIKIMMCCMFYD